MEQERYYKIIPKDNDPEVAKVLDFITNTAKRHFDYYAMEKSFNPIADPDFFLFQTLVVLANKQNKVHFIGQTHVEFLMSGRMIEMGDIKKLVDEIEQKCNIEVFAMGMATDLMFNQGWPPLDVLTNISQLLAGR